GGGQVAEPAPDPGDGDRGSLFFRTAVAAGRSAGAPGAAGGPAGIRGRCFFGRGSTSASVARERRAPCFTAAGAPTDGERAAARAVHGQRAFRQWHRGAALVRSG